MVGVTPPDSADMVILGSEDMVILGSEDVVILGSEDVVILGSWDCCCQLMESSPDLAYKYLCGGDHYNGQ